MDATILGRTIGIDDTRIDGSIEEIRTQIREYERGTRREFDLEVEILDGMTGDVMAAMREIPYGETRSYGDIAADLGTAPVAVGQACGRNPVPLIVPCHRVIKTNGGLGGFSAAGGVDTKRRLLEFEAQESGEKPVQTRLPIDE